MIGGLIQEFDDLLVSLTARAIDSAVSPRSVCAFTFAPARTRISTMSARLLAAAIMSAVTPPELAALTSTPFFNNACTTGSAWFAVASMRGCRRLAHRARGVRSGLQQRHGRIVLAVLRGDAERGETCLLCALGSAPCATRIFTSSGLSR